MKKLFEKPGRRILVKKMEDRIKLPAEWQGWKIEEYLGSGSYGSVYSAYFLSSDGDEPEEYSAIKIIQIPADEKEAAAIASDYPDKVAQNAYYEGVVDALLEEIHTMERLKDHPNAVRIQDHLVVHEEELKWTIYIRMELLTPFSDYQIYEEMDEQKVIRLGIDMCSVLEECAGLDIIHRDIKPENIMVDDEGNFKLGDFGIARKMEKTAKEFSLKGTFTYMAPEVNHGEKYDNRVDQYSLGIVLYRLMNRNRDPFTDVSAQVVSLKEREEALRTRMEGEVLPKPANASESFGRIIRKACAFRPENRFEKISDMKAALESCLCGEEFEINNLVEISEEERLALIRQKKRKKRLTLVISVAAGLAVLLGISVFLQTRKTDEEILAEESDDIETDIEKNGIRKDNSLAGIDISEIAAEQYELNRTDDAREILASMKDMEALRKENDIDGRQDYDNCECSVIYMDDANVLGLAVNYNIYTDPATNRQMQEEMPVYYYFTKEGGRWFAFADDQIPQEVWESCYETYFPEGFIESYKAGRNCCAFDYNNTPGYWIETGTAFEGIISLESAAAWQNEDGSVDLYMICRNGTDTEGSESKYWASLEDDDAGVIVKAWGNLNSGQVSVEPGGMKGYLLHFEADEVESETKAWSDFGPYHFTSGYNSSYER